MDHHDPPKALQLEGPLPVNHRIWLSRRKVRYSAADISSPSSETSTGLPFARRTESSDRDAGDNCCMNLHTRGVVGSERRHHRMPTLRWQVYRLRHPDTDSLALWPEERNRSRARCSCLYPFNGFSSYSELRALTSIMDLNHTIASHPLSLSLDAFMRIVEFLPFSTVYRLSLV